MKIEVLKKLLISIVALGVCHAHTMAGPPSGAVKIGDYYYLLNSNTKTATVTYDSGEMPDSKNYSSLTSINVPSTVTYRNVTYIVTEIGEYAFNRTKATTAVIPNTVTKINERSFYWSSLEKIELPTTITELPPRSLAENENLKTVTGLDNVKIVRSHAFANSKMAYVSLPNVTHIYGAAFYYCTALQSINLGDKLITLGMDDETFGDVFYNCPSLRNITLPATLTEIGGMLCRNFPVGITITCKASTPPNATDSEYNNFYKAFYKNSTLIVPTSYESKYKSTAPWSYFTKLNPVLVSSISFAKSQQTLEIGKSATVTPTVYPTNATEKEVTYSTSNSNVATVTSSTGIVTGKAVGTATITATAKDGSGVSGSYTVNVVAPALTGIKLDKTAATIKDSETLKLTATLQPTGAEGTITWTSSYTSIATVDANGLVKGVEAGSTTITAKCGSYSATCKVTVTQTPAASVSLDKTTLSLKATETATLSATVLPENATDKTVKWSTSNSKIATVDANGKVTAIAVGNATITAACGNLSATCQVTVSATPAASITLNKTAITLKATESETLTANVMPATTTDKTVTWTSSDDKVATVDANGTVTAIAVGKATITATCGSVKATCAVTVNATAASSITLSKTTLSLKATESETLTANVMPETTTDKTVTWTSSDDKVATVDANGKVTAIAVGNATISASCGSVSASCKVTVETTPAESVEINVSSSTLRAGESTKLVVTVKPSTTTNPSVTYTSSNPSVATVDAEGNVTAVGVGETVITVTCGNVSSTITIKVEPTPAATINLDKTEVNLKATQNITLTATVAPETTTDKTIVWKSADETIATVANGVVTAVSVGKTTITATCGSVSATCQVTVSATPAESVNLNKTAITLKATESETLTATILPATTTDKTVTWATSDDKVATVDANGKVTAIAVGNATITATCGSVSATCAVTVSATSAASITLNKTAIVLKATQTETLTATVLPATTTVKVIEWSTSDAKVATIDANGKVTAVAVGTATITATCGSVSATCAVTVEATPAESVEINVSTSTLRAGESTKLVVTVKPSTTTNPSVTFTSSDNSVATVDAEGNVTAVGVGEAIITVTCGDVSSTIIIKVVDTIADSITLDKTAITLKATETETLSATVLPESTTDKTVTWSTSDAKVATVDANGKVTAVAVGTTTITATCGSVSATCAVTVEATPAESVEINVSTSTLRAGESTKLVVTVKPSTTTNPSVTFTSSDNSVATVDAEGNVTAVGVGEAIITVTCGDVSSTIIIKVVDTIADSITLDKTAITLKATETETLSATVLPESTTDKTVTWSTSDAKVATVDANGKVTAVAVGTTTITATCGSVSATCAVTVEATPAEEIKVEISQPSVTVGETITLKVEIYPATTTDKNLTFSSSNPDVAVVDEDGNVTAVGVGEAIITIVCGDVTTTITITVDPILATSITLDTTVKEAIEGDSFQLTATVEPDNVTNATVAWSSSDESIATVDSEGLVHVLKAGECIITAATTDGSNLTAECQLSVLSGIEMIFVENGRSINVYDFRGTLILRDATLEQYRSLSPGFYIVNGIKYLKK